MAAMCELPVRANHIFSDSPARGRRIQGRESIDSEWSSNVRFGSLSGLKSDIA
jgi:hypothetical protein